MKALIKTTLFVALLVSSQWANAATQSETNQNDSSDSQNVSDVIDNYWNSWEVTADELGHSELFGNQDS